LPPLPPVGTETSTSRILGAPEGNRILDPGFNSLGILNLSLRVYSLLKKAGILTLNDLLQHTKADLLKIVVYSNVLEIETTLASLGLGLKECQ
jgi:DNA-directed RNA polymerase alpha subunit